ncbi:hypothetical protein [Sulfuricurvum sp.]|uniref:hypothetical protein n=1 Tax=Sulfuricurvum sp. TaxID=2025608 RepID=UPI00260C6042|nr:hypothetical protein [Sulfuricurvum sp.]MDD4950837.1 hypothetical protein [Sulfuricurvum sp.]
MTLDIAKHLKLSNEELKQTCLFYARCQIVDQIEIMERHGRLIHKLRSTNVDELSLPELSFIAMTKSIRSLMNDRNSLRRKSYGEMDIEEIEKLSEMKIRRFFDNNTDQETVRSKLIQKWPLVVSLRTAPIKKGNKPLSFKKLALIVKKELHLEQLAPSTIFKLWHELEAKNSKKDEQ